MLGIIGLGIASAAMRRSGTSIDSAATAYSAAMTTPLTQSRLARVSTLVAGLKAAGIWPKLDWLLLLANETEQGSRVNLRNPAKVATVVNSPTFTADRGWTGNGTSAHLDCGEAVNLSPNVYSLNSAHAGSICTAQTTTGGSPSLGGASDARLHLNMLGDGGTEVFSINDATTSSSRASSSKLGHRIAARGAAGTKRAYYNGTLSATVSVASAAQPAGNLCVLRRSTIYSPDRIGVFHSGSNLTDSEVSTLYTLLMAYLDAIGAGVSAPGAFADGQWSIATGPGAGQATITLSALPSRGGSPITATQYRVNGGSATSLGLTAAGSATISGLGNGATPNVEIRAVNEIAGAGAWSSVKTVTTYTAPANTVAPSISGGTTQGATLTAAAGTWTGTPTPTIAGQWRVNGSDVSGATGSTFSTSSLAVGDVVTYRETATNVVSAVSATSSGVTLTAPDAAPVNTVLPAISGDDTVGSTLTATAGTWTGSPTPTYAYQWRANGSNVSGATSSTFATTLLSAGDVVTCRVTATNIAGSASATSSGVTLTADTGPTEIPDAIILSGRSSEMVAPEGITFSPDLALVGTHFGISAPAGVYDARMHDVYYVWSFGEAGSFAAPQHLLPEHMDRNRAIGPAVAHVYRTPGTYTARLDMYGTIGGAPAHAYSERTVTVGSSASMFAGAQTYFVSPSSDWTNAPSGSQHVTSLDNAAEWANEGGGPYRIMLNRGETHTWGGRRFGFNTAAACTIHVVAGPGGGAKPILTCTGVFGCGGFDDATYVNKALVVQGLVMNGPYDPITPGEPEVTGAFSSFGSYAPQQMLIDDCEIRNFGNFLYIGDDTSRHIYMHDNIMEGYGQSGVAGAHADGLILLGNRILSAAGAPIDNSVNMGATVRTGAGVMTFISHANDIECAQGWSGLGGGYIAVQPCIRVESEGVAGQTINITNCTFAGGFTQLSIANGDDPSVILNAIIDGCYFLGSYQSGNVIGAENAGTTVRNNIAVIPNPATRIGPGLSSFVVLINVGGGASLVPPMKVYGNTIVNLTSDTLGVVANNGGYSNVTTQNNVIHQPAASPAQTADAPLVTTPALWTPREMGYMDRATPRITASATPSGTPAAYSLDTGSDAIGDATTGLIPPFNIIGDDRADPPNRGAW